MHKRSLRQAMRNFASFLRTAKLLSLFNFLQLSFQRIVLFLLLTVSLFKSLEVLLQHLVFPSQSLIFHNEMLRLIFKRFHRRGINLTREPVVKRGDSFVLGGSAFGLVYAWRPGGSLDQSFHCLKLLYVYVYVWLWALIAGIIYDDWTTRKGHPHANVRGTRQVQYQTGRCRQIGRNTSLNSVALASGESKRTPYQNLRYPCRVARQSLLWSTQIHNSE